MLKLNYKHKNQTKGEALYEKNIVSLTISTIIVSSLICGCTLASENSSQTETQAISSTNNSNLESPTSNEENIILGTVKSVSESSIIIEVFQNRGGRGPKNSNEGSVPAKDTEAPEGGETKIQPEITEGGNSPEQTQSAEASEVNENVVPSEATSTNENAVPPERPDSEEITIEISESSKFYKEENSETSEIDLSDITEGSFVKVTLEENSENTAESVTLTEMREPSAGGQEPRLEKEGDNISRTTNENASQN